MGDVARSNLIFGLHVHVGVPNREEGIRIQNIARYFYRTFMRFLLLHHFGKAEIRVLNLLDKNICKIPENWHS